MVYEEKVKSGKVVPDKEENEFLVERKAFVFKADTKEEEDSVAYSESENQLQKEKE